MKTFLAVLGVLLILGLVAGDLYSADRPRLRRRPRPDRDDIGDGDKPETKNVYEIRGTLKSVSKDGEYLAVSVVQKEGADPVVMVFKLSGETRYRGLREGQKLADLPEGQWLYVRYRAVKDEQYNGKALNVNVLRRRIKRTRPAETQ